MKVADKYGKWFTNFSQFRMHDPMSDTYFEPSEPTKATPTAWLAAQSATIKLTDDEGLLVEAEAETEAEKPVEAEKPAEAEKSATKK